MSSGPVILLTITFELMVISQDFCSEVVDGVPINISRSNILRKKMLSPPESPTEILKTFSPHVGMKGLTDHS